MNKFKQKTLWCRYHILKGLTKDSQGSLILLYKLVKSKKGWKGITIFSESCIRLIKSLPVHSGFICSHHICSFRHIIAMKVHLKIQISTSQEIYISKRWGWIFQTISAFWCKNWNDKIVEIIGILFRACKTSHCLPFIFS